MDYVNALPGNKPFVDVIKQYAPKLQVKENVREINQDVIMGEASKFDFNADCEAFLEAKMQKMKDSGKTDVKKEVKVDPVSELEEKAEVVMGDK